VEMVREFRPGEAGGIPSGTWGPRPSASKMCRNYLKLLTLAARVSPRGCGRSEPSLIPPIGALRPCVHWHPSAAEALETQLGIPRVFYGMRNWHPVHPRNHGSNPRFRRRTHCPPFCLAPQYPRCRWDSISAARRKRKWIPALSPRLSGQELSRFAPAH